jgi:CBS domain-containing protein
MREFSVRLVPVIDAMGRLVGILSISDLARAASHGLGVLRAPEVARTVDAVAHPHGRPHTD